MAGSVGITYELSEEQATYLDACARLRDTTRRRLLGSILKHVLNDQLIVGIMDDADEIAKMQTRKKKFGKPHPIRSASRPSMRGENHWTAKRARALAESAL